MTFGQEWMTLIHECLAFIHEYMCYILKLFQVALNKTPLKEKRSEKEKDQDYEYEQEDSAHNSSADEKTFASKVSSGATLKNKIRNN